MPTAPAPTLKIELVSMVEVANLELLPVQAWEPTRPVVMFRQPLARVSIRKTEVEATPAVVRAVVEALVTVPVTTFKLLIDELALLTISAPLTVSAVVEALVTVPVTTFKLLIDELALL